MPNIKMQFATTILALALGAGAFAADPLNCRIEPEPIFDGRHTGVSSHEFESQRRMDAVELLVLTSGLRVQVRHFACTSYTMVFEFHPADPNFSTLSLDSLLARVEGDLSELIPIDPGFDLGKRALRLIQDYPAPQSYEPTKAMVDAKSGGRFHFAFRNSPETGGVAIMHFEIKL